MIELLKRFAGTYRHYFIVGPAFKSLEVLFDLISPLIVAYMIDEGVGQRDFDTVLQCAAMLAVMSVVGLVFTLVCQKMAAKTSQGMGTDIRHALYEHINTLGFVELDRFGTPSLITRITNDVNQVQLAIALLVRMIIRWPVLAIGSMIAALLIDWQLGLIFLIVTPAIGLGFWFIMARCVPYFRGMQHSLDRLALLQREALSGARHIRAFVREDHERARFSHAADEQAHMAILQGKLSALLNPMVLLLMNLAVCAILWQGGIAVDAGRLTPGQIVAFVNYMTQVLLAIVFVANLVVVFTRASASAARVLEVLDTPPGVISPRTPVTSCSFASVAPHTPALRANHVSFVFGEGATPAVKDISFELMPGESLGIIGGTGAGKSTLISLIPRLYDTSAGVIQIYGCDVRSAALDDLRHLIGFVPQRATLLSGTIRSNLLMRQPIASDEQLWRALDIAQAADFVRQLPEALDAPVEAAGKNFSGGQRQRLTIARALVGEPELLILDDAASALDLKTDASLRASLRMLARERADTRPLTTVIVSQRVSAVQGASRILVMRRGVSAGLGTHEELIRTCTVYQEICASQGAALPHTTLQQRRTSTTCVASAYGKEASDAQ